MKCLDKLNKLNNNIKIAWIRKIIIKLTGLVNEFLIIYLRLLMNKGKRVRDLLGMDLFELFTKY